MVAIVLIVLFTMVLATATNAVAAPHHRQKAVVIVVGSFFLRLLINIFISRSLSFFSHGVAGGDASIYEFYGEQIASMWNLSSVHFVTNEEFHDLGSVALPCNLFALLIYLNDGPTTLGCTAVIAFVACLACVEIYRFSRELGSSADGAMIIMLLSIFGPSFVYHTSDTYKDGLNAFLVLVSVTGSVRLARQFSVSRLLTLALSLWALWYVRNYMVYMCLLPVAVGLVGTRSTSAVRKIVSVLSVIMILLVAGGSLISKTVETAEETFERGNNQDNRAYNVEMGGSGVTFDDGGNAFGAIGPKILYTIGSPFPWQGGSVGLQLGKIDVLIWYYLIYRAYLGARIMWKKDRRTLIMLLTFIIPATIIYASSMANIGLIVRQRMPIVMLTSMLSAVSWQVRRGSTQPTSNPAPRLVATTGRRSRLVPVPR